jgi:hypothetical protein
VISIQALLAIGFLFGVGVGGLLSKGKLGCIALLAVPVAAVTYVSWWHGENPDLVRSTSGLEFLFVPIPPSTAALAGFAVVYLIRNWLSTRNL